MIEVIVTTATEKQYKDTLNAEMQSSLVDICLNLMVITRAEAESIREDAEEYINLTLDCCDKQTSRTVKSQACKLLEAICDNVFGAITYITNFCCSAINLALQGDAGRVYDTEVIEGTKTSVFLTRTDKIFIADTCLLALTCMSYVIPQRVDLVKMFEETISGNVGTFLTRHPIAGSEVDVLEAAKTVILRSRFGLLLGYYADMLFNNKPEAFQQTLNFLLESIGQI